MGVRLAVFWSGFCLSLLDKLHKRLPLEIAWYLRTE
jgi:hypothetical protein